MPLGPASKSSPQQGTLNDAAHDTFEIVFPNEIKNQEAKPDQAAMPSEEIATPPQGIGSPPDGEVITTDMPLDSYAIDSHLVPIPEEVSDRAIEAISVPFDGPMQELPTVGASRALFSMFEIESARPQSVFRLRFDSAYKLNRPDRSEYFWKKIGGGGPSQPEQNVDFQEFRLYNETSRGKASGFFELPLRFSAPDVNGNSAGISDIQVGAKTQMLEGDDFFWIPTTRFPNDRFLVSSVFRTYISISPKLAKRGLSTGHVTLEPGLLANYEITPRTLFHGEVKVWIPMGGTKDFSGEVLKYGLGVSHVLYSTLVDSPECKYRAVIPTLELNAWSFLRGMQTIPGVTEPASIDGRTVVNIQPGVRFVLDKRVEIGISTAFNVSGTRLYENLVRFEIRWFR